MLEVLGFFVLTNREMGNEPARSVRYLSEWNESSSEILDSLLHTAETESNTHVLSHCRNGFIFHAYSDLALKTITEFP